MDLWRTREIVNIVHREINMDQISNIVIYVVLGILLLGALGSIVWLFIYLFKFGPSPSDKEWPCV